MKGSLFRKYVVLFATAVGATLLATWLLGTYFAYEDHKKALVSIQREKALAAVSKIEQFIKEIERQINWTTHRGAGPPALDQRHLDYLRLLRQVPAVTEISQLDSSGARADGTRRIASRLLRAKRSPIAASSTGAGVWRHAAGSLPGAMWTRETSSGTSAAATTRSGGGSSRSR